MTMREKLIEAMARALYEQFAADDISCTYCSWELLGDKQSWRDRALPALDAALDMLETPSEEMWRAGSDELAETALDNHAVAIQAQKTFRAMLATLRSPKI